MIQTHLRIAYNKGKNLKQLQKNDLINDLG